MNGDSFSYNLLKSYDTEQVDELKTLASVAFHHRLMSENRPQDDALTRLKKDIRAYGPDLEARRQAAFAGILIMNRLDLMRQDEVIGQQGSVSVSLGRFLEPNRPLVRVVAEHWDHIRQEFGEDFTKRLSGHMSALSIPEALAQVANEFNGVQDYIFDLAERDEQLATSPPILRLLSAVYPRSELLRTRCLAALRRDDGTWGAYDKLRNVVAILVEQFGGDDAVLMDILAGSNWSQGGYVEQGQILSICTGWPTHPLIDRLYQDSGNAWSERRPYPETISILCARIPSKDFATEFARHLRYVSVATPAPYARLALLDAVTSRLKRDAEVRTDLANEMPHTHNPDIKATIPKVLAEFGELTDEFLSWMREELRAQLSSTNGAELGFDLLDGTTRGVPLCLRDVLQNYP